MTSPENKYFEFAKEELCELVRKKKALQENFSLDQADNLKEIYGRLIDKVVECIKLGLDFDEKESEITVSVGNTNIAIAKKDLVEVMGEKQFCIFFKPEKKEETPEAVEAVIDNSLLAGLNNFKEMNGEDNMFAYMMYGILKSFDMYKENHAAEKKPEKVQPTVVDKELEDKYEALVKENGALMSSNQWLEAENAKIKAENEEIRLLCKELSIKHFAACEEIRSAYDALENTEKQMDSLIKEHRESGNNLTEAEEKLKRRIRTLEDEANTSAKTIKELKKEIADAKEKYSGLKRNIEDETDASKNEMDKLIKSQKDASDRAKKAENKAKELQQIISRNENEIKTAKDEVARAKKEIAELKKSLADVKEAAAEEGKVDVDEGLYKLAYTDALTGVNNGNAFSRDVKEMDIKKVVIGMTGIRGLKAINDAYGRADGDGVITYVAEGIADAFGPEATYRIMGDQFIIVGEVPSKKMKAELAKLKKSLKENNINIVFYAASYDDVVAESSAKPECVADIIEYVEDKIAEQKKDLFVMLTGGEEGIREDELEDDFEKEISKEQAVSAPASSDEDEKKEEEDYIEEVDIDILDEDDDDDNVLSDEDILGDFISERVG